MSQAEDAVGRAESSAADVYGNCREALYFAERGNLAEAAQSLKWAEENARSLVYRIGEARDAISKATRSVS